MDIICVLTKTGSIISILLDDVEPPRAGHRPAVDVLFEDNSQYNDFDKIVVIMTGMGSDGAIGLTNIKSKMEMSSPLPNQRKHASFMECQKLQLKLI